MPVEDLVVAADRPAAGRPDARWDVSLEQLIAGGTARFRDHVAARDEAGRALTFGALDAMSANLARTLTARGVGPGVRVAWQLPTWLETLVLTCALSRVQAVQIPLPYMYRAHEVRAALAQTDADLLITPQVWHGHDYAAMAAQVGADLPQLRRAIVSRDRLDALDWFAGLTQLPARGARDDLSPEVMWVFFTSGTSGSPKGVLHTDRSVTIPATTMADAFELTTDDRSAVAFPLGHVGGVTWLIAALQTGCSLLLAERFDAATIDTFAAQGVTLAGVSTAFHLAYRNQARAQPGRALFPLVRACPGGAATKPATLHREVQDEIGGVGIVSGYGLTECPMISMSTVHDPDEKLRATEGRPGPGVIIESHDLVSGALLAPGTAGEIWVRAPQMFRRYFQAEDTREAFDARGFFRTGDIGHLDDDGFLIISGRLKDVIIRKGENISAKEVEDHIFAHPDIADVAVVGLPDERVGELCCAVLVTRPGRPAPSVRALGEFLQGRGLMTQKWPERTLQLAELPRNPAGKVLKHELIRGLTQPGRDPLAAKKG